MFIGKGRLLGDKPSHYSVAGKPALPIRCGVFHTRLMIGCPQWQATQGSSIFGGWQANLAKHVAVSATLTFATPQAAYANSLRSANFYIMQDRYAQCSRPKSIAHKGHYAKVGWQFPPTRVAKRGSVMSLRGLSPDSLATLALRGAVRSLRGVFVPRCGKIASAKAQAQKSASSCPQDAPG